MAIVKEIQEGGEKSEGMAVGKYQDIQADLGTMIQEVER